METTYRVDRTTPRAARSFVRSAVDDPRSVASAELAVSELVTNVIRHAPATERVTVRVHGAEPVRLEVIEHGVSGDGRLRQSDGPGAWPPPSELHGRGLGILDAISADWGFERRGADRAAWCEIMPAAPED